MSVCSVTLVFVCLAAATTAVVLPATVQKQAPTMKCNKACHVEEGQYVNGSISCKSRGAETTCGRFITWKRDCDVVCQAQQSDNRLCHQGLADVKVDVVGSQTSFMFTVRKCKAAIPAPFQTNNDTLAATPRCRINLCTRANPFLEGNDITCNRRGILWTCSKWLTTVNQCETDRNICRNSRSSHTCIAAFRNRYCSQGFEPVFVQCRDYANFDHSPYLDFCQECNRPPFVKPPTSEICAQMNTPPA